MDHGQVKDAPTGRHPVTMNYSRPNNVSQEHVSVSENSVLVEVIQALSLFHTTFLSCPHLILVSPHLPVSTSSAYTHIAPKNVSDGAF